MEVGCLFTSFRRTAFAFGFIALTTLLCTVGQAGALDPLSKPSGTVVLSVKGKIGNANSAQSAEFDMGMLKSLPPTIINTHTPWTDGLTQFKGISVSELLRTLAASGTHGEFSALNDYTVRIPLSDFDTFNAIIAYEMNAAPMSRREKGPLWLIYPMDSQDILQTPRYRDRMIWQLRSITVQ